MSRTDSKAGFSAVLVRIAEADRAAFAGLNARLRPRLATELATVPLDSADVAAVADATFVEVWRLAGRFPGHETDAFAWIRAIAARRAGDRRLARLATPSQDGTPI